MPTEHSFIDIYSTLLCVSFLLSIVELRLSTLNKPISDLTLIPPTGSVGVLFKFPQLVWAATTHLGAF